MSMIANKFMNSNTLAVVREVTVEEAARRMGGSERWLRARCMGEWGPKGLARREETPTGSRWLIREEAAPELVPQVKAVEPYLEGLAERHIQELRQRILILRGWQAACRRAPKGTTIEEVYRSYAAELGAEATALSTLYEWQRRCDQLGFPQGMIDKRWRKTQGPSGIDEPFFVEARRLYLSGQRRSVRLCWKMATGLAVERGWKCCSLVQTRKHFKRQIPLGQIILRRHGRKALTNEAESYWERDFSGLDVNAMWTGDHHQCDVSVKVGERVNRQSGEVTPIYARPWLTAWQDCRSRKIVAWMIYADDPNVDPILITLRKGILEFGKPQEVYIDNGKDYDSLPLQGMSKRQRLQRVDDLKRKRSLAIGTLGLLQIGVHHAEPYHGQSKIIERFFGTFEEQFGKMWDTYIGNKPENRPDEWKRNLEAGKAPTLEEFTAAAGTWIEKVYNETGHTGDSMNGQSPNAVYRELLPRFDAVPVETLEVCMQKITRPVRVTQNGVRWDGITYGKSAPQSFKNLIGKHVILRVDPSDVTSVSAWTDEGEESKFICRLASNRRLPFKASRELLRAAMKQKRSEKKVLLAYSDVRLRMHDDLTDRMVRMANNNAAAKDSGPSTPPAPIRINRTAIDAQVPAYQEALNRPLRKAAGAESLSVDQQLALYERAKDE